MRKLLWVMLLMLSSSLSSSFFTSCQRTPPLHLHAENTIGLGLPMVQLDLLVYWNYHMDYDWETYWTYGWDDVDEELFGKIGYTEPKVFDLRRYALGFNPGAPHNWVTEHHVEGNTFVAQYDYGYYDILVWNEINIKDGAQSLILDEETTLDSVMAFTNMSMYPSLYRSYKVDNTRAESLPQYNRAFYQPEELFSAYEEDLHISQNMEDYDYYDEETNTYYKYADMTLHPLTYIYLIQVRLHHNKFWVDGVNGEANLSGMARSATLNSGMAGREAVTVHYNTRFKKHCIIKQTGEDVDVIGGRCLTFGIPNQNSSRVTRAEDVKDEMRHYVDVNMVFYNGLDSTFVFDVTDSIRKYYKGGVITIDLDMDTIKVPLRGGGNGFDAVVKEFEEETHEFDI